MVSNHPEIMSLWARNRIDSLRRESYASQFNGNGKDLKAAITETALQFGIMSEYTSFVAVENRVINEGGKQRIVPVPVDLAQGVNYDTTVNSISPMAAGRASLSAGGMGGGAAAIVPSNSVMKRIQIHSADPAFIAGAMHGSVGQNGKVGSAQNGTAATGGKADPLSKADPNVRYGMSDVELWLTNVDEVTLKKLKDLGVKIGTKDKTLKLVFAQLGKADLERVCELKEVLRISSAS